MSKTGQPIPCPSCGHRHRSNSELAGRRVRCSRCGHVFLFPYAKPDTEPELYELAQDPEDEPPPPSPPPLPAEATASNQPLGSRASDRPAEQHSQDHDLLPTPTALKWTAVGFTLHAIGCVGMIVGLMAGWVASVGGEGFALASGLLATASLIPFAFGPLLTLAAPARAGRNWGFAAVGLFVTGLVLDVALELASPAAFLGVVLFFLAQLLVLLGIGAYLVFIERLAAFLDHDRLHDRTRFLQRTLMFIIIALLILPIPIIGWLMAIGVAVAALIFAVCYPLLLIPMARLVWHRATH